MKLMKINPNSNWAKRTRFKKRIDGFACYIVCAVMALFYPEATDMVLYSELKTQFIDD